MKKIPAVTLLFWVMKICATTLGETAGDLLSMTLNVGYGVSSLILFSIFLAVLAGQLAVRRYVPVLYWAVILATSTAGTTLSDYMDRTLGLGYAAGAALLVTLLLLTLGLWWQSEKSLSVNDIKTRKGELFYWTAILFSNTLGTALGDFLPTTRAWALGAGRCSLAAYWPWWCWRTTSRGCRAYCCFGWPLCSRGHLGPRLATC
jgi:uncharacterized membrane-anchored protein